MDSGCPTTPAKIAGMNIEICESRSERAVQKLAVELNTEQDQRDPGQSTCIIPQLSLSHLIRVKSAELWLILGEPDKALRELEALSSKSWNHPSAVKVRVGALEMLGERTGASAQE